MQRDFVSFLLRISIEGNLRVTITSRIFLPFDSFRSDKRSDHVPRIQRRIEKDNSSITPVSPLSCDSTRFACVCAFAACSYRLCIGNALLRMHDPAFLYWSLPVRDVGYSVNRNCRLRKTHFTDLLRRYEHHVYEHTSGVVSRFTRMLYVIITTRVGN
jgi:hypothetical protein